MNRSNTVYRKTIMDINVSHVYSLIFIDDLYLRIVIFFADSLI